MRWWDAAYDARRRHRTCIWVVGSVILAADARGTDDGKRMDDASDETGERRAVEEADVVVDADSEGTLLGS